MIDSTVYCCHAIVAQQIKPYLLSIICLCFYMTSDLYVSQFVMQSVKKRAFALIPIITSANQGLRHVSSSFHEKHEMGK